MQNDSELVNIGHDIFVTSAELAEIPMKAKPITGGVRYEIVVTEPDEEFGESGGILQIEDRGNGPFATESNIRFDKLPKLQVHSMPTDQNGDLENCGFIVYTKGDDYTPQLIKVNEGRYFSYDDGKYFMVGTERINKASVVQDAQLTSIGKRFVIVHGKYENYGDYDSDTNFERCRLVEAYSLKGHSEILIETIKECEHQDDFYESDVYKNCEILGELKGKTLIAIGKNDESKRYLFTKDGEIHELEFNRGQLSSGGHGAQDHALLLDLVCQDGINDGLFCYGDLDKLNMKGIQDALNDPIERYKIVENRQDLFLEMCFGTEEARAFTMSKIQWENSRLYECLAEKFTPENRTFVIANLVETYGKAAIEEQVGKIDNSQHLMPLLASLSEVKSPQEMQAHHKALELNNNEVNERFFQFLEGIGDDGKPLSPAQAKHRKDFESLLMEAEKERYWQQQRDAQTTLDDRAKWSPAPAKEPAKPSFRR